MYNLLLSSVLLMPTVFLRTLPVAVLTALVYFGLIQNTPNPLWKMVFILLLTTPSIAIVRMAALRAALVAIDRTTPPTFDNLTKAQMRLAYANLLPINLVQMLAMGLVTLLLTVGFDDSIMNVITEYATNGATTKLQELIEKFAAIAQAAGWLFSIIAAVGFGAMGTAMAGTAANAAEKKPRHDIVFGIGYNFWHLTALYYIAQLLNGIVAVVFAILIMAVIRVGDMDLTLFVVPITATLYISMHFATTAAGAALSYGELLDENAEIRAFVQRNLAGPEASPDALRKLRRSRQQG